MIVPTTAPAQGLTKEQKLARFVDQQLLLARNVMAGVYARVRASIFENPEFSEMQTIDGKRQRVFRPDLAYAAIVANTQIDLTADELRDSAMVAKAVINRRTPGSIVDDVPEAIITLPTMEA